MIDIEGKCKMFGNDKLCNSVGSRKHPDRVIVWSKDMKKLLMML